MVCVCEYFSELRNFQCILRNRENIHIKKISVGNLSMDWGNRASGPTKA